MIEAPEKAMAPEGQLAHPCQIDWYLSHLCKRKYFGLSLCMQGANRRG